MSAAVEPPGYPAHLAADVVARDGGTVHLRPIRPDDAPRIAALHSRLSSETIYFRFFTPLSTLSPAMLERFVVVDYRDRLALVATLGDDIVAVGRYERLPSGDGRDAEVAFLVDDAHQGRGLGTVLLEHLAGAARGSGISRFVADTLPDNSRMLRVFHDAGFDDERRFEDGVVRVVFPIEATESSDALVHDREREAAASSVRRLLTPATVAVVGANREAGRLGHELVRRLLEGGFEGPVLPVNPSARHVAGVKAYPSVLDVPDRIDLAVVVVPADAVADVVDQCARAHVGGLLVVSAGFAELGPDGQAAERALVAAARRNGMRLIGPSAMGVVNTDPAVSLNATFSPMPRRGRIGFIAQSGGLGGVLLDELDRRGLGVSTFVSAGNKADVSGNDLLQYWDQDPGTDVALMYIESFGNPRTFARVARRVSRRKPIVAVKSGRSAAGSRAAGQTVAVRQDDVAVDALFRHAGVIRTDTLEELFDVAQLLASQPLPAGRRVAIVGNRGGPGVLAADAASDAGLEVVGTSADSGPDPAGLAPDARPAQFGAALAAVLADGGVDAAVVLFTSPSATPVEEVAAAIGEAAAAAPGKPVVACALGRRGLLDAGPGRPPVPAYAFPEAAARALGRVAAYAEWRRRPPGALPPLPGVDRDRARAVVARPGLADADGWLTPDGVAALLDCYAVTATAAPVADHAAWGVGAGIIQDPLFGPLVTLWSGPRDAGADRRSSARALPVTDLDAAELCREVLGPDRPQRDPWAALLARLGRLAEDVPELSVLDLHPVVVGADGVTATARARFGPHEARPDLALRRLR